VTGSLWSGPPVVRVRCSRLGEEGLHGIKRRRHPLGQIIGELAAGEKLFGQGQLIGEVAGHLEVTESTQHRWRNQYGGMRAKDAKRLGELAKENQRRKRIVADQALDIDPVGECPRSSSRVGARTA